MNTPVREPKSSGENKTESRSEDFAAVLESSTTASEEEKQVKADTVEKSDPKEGNEKSEGTKEEKDISIPLLPAELILQKNQQEKSLQAGAIPASEPSAAPQADQKPAGATAVSAEIAVPAETAAKDTVKEAGEPQMKEAAEFKLPAQAPDSKNAEQQTAEASIPKEDSMRTDAPKPEPTKANETEAKTAIAGDPGQNIKAAEARTARESTPAQSSPAAERNVQTAAREIMHKAQTMSDGESTTIKVKLHPEGIGEMEITVSMEKGRISGSILVDNKEARQIFTERIHELHQTLKDSNIQVAKLDVGIGAGQDQSQGRQPGQRQVFYHNRTMRYIDEIPQLDEARTHSAAVRGIDVLA